MGGVFLSLGLRDLLNRSRQILDYHQLVMVQQGIDKQEKLEPFGDLVQHKIGHLLTADAFSITLFPIQEAREQNNTKITRRFHPKYAFFCQRPYSYLQVVIPSGASTQLHELHSRQKDVELTTLRWPPKAQRDAAFGPKAGEYRIIFIRMHEQQAMNITEPRSAAYSSLQQTSTVLTTREGVVSVRSYRGGGAAFQISSYNDDSRQSSPQRSHYYTEFGSFNVIFARLKISQDTVILRRLEMNPSSGSNPMTAASSVTFG
ncbi:hypothetical protein MP228_001227 [Amoeboaphelidium protococcarum]|nr:hypothetical protein MP228_001227 [Amoeboaphelidium protococcarum]